VLDTLAAIVARGARLALISDGALDVQRRKWAALRLPFRFQPVVFTDEKGRAYWKPNPWAFERVMSAHRDGGRFVFVGDNPAKDFLAPNRLGWTTAMVRDPRNVHPAVFDAGDPGAPQIVLDSFFAVAGLM
jgi:putative hydrolase of the HAD superfamily